MGNWSRAKREQMENNKRKQELEKICGEVKNFKEGEGEEFEVKVKKVSNGYIIEKADGVDSLVFNDEKYPSAIEFIISRRLIKMKPGEEIYLRIEQRFTKIIKDDKHSTTECDVNNP
jgi:hypothetical protein